MNYNINETCATCLRKTKVVLLDLNSFDPKRRKIRFKRCKKNMQKEKEKEKEFCIILILDKICINMNGNFGRR